MQRDVRQEVQGVQAIAPIVSLFLNVQSTLRQFSGRLDMAIFVVQPGLPEKHQGQPRGIGQSFTDTQTTLQELLGQGQVGFFEREARQIVLGIGHPLVVIGTGTQLQIRLQVLPASS
jgi:hypothetical protein